MNSPSDEEILDRAVSLANEAMFTVAMQRRRIDRRELEDEDFAMRSWADVQFLIVSLRRARRCAEIALAVSPTRHEVQRALAEFDRAVPHLSLLRNVGEHIDAYAVDKGRDPTVSRAALQVGSWTADRLEWLGYEVDFIRAQDATNELLEALRAARRSLRAP